MKKSSLKNLYKSSKKIEFLFKSKAFKMQILTIKSIFFKFKLQNQSLNPKCIKQNHNMRKFYITLKKHSF